MATHRRWLISALATAVSLALIAAACGTSGTKTAATAPASTPASSVMPSTQTASTPGATGAKPTPTPTPMTKGKPVQLPPDLQSIKLPPEMPGATATPAPSKTIFKPPSPRTTQTSVLNAPASETVSQRVTPSSPASFALSDGARVQIPTGAVASEMTITAKKLAPSGPDSKSSNVYEIGQQDTVLKTNVTLTLPFNAASIPAGTPDSEIRVAYYKQNEGWTEVPATIDRAAGKATVQTNHFSTWGIFWPGFWASQFDPKKPAIVLSVPHYYQGGAGWGWAASTAMLLKYFGRDVEIWDVAEAFDADYSTGLSGGEFLIGYYSAFVQAQGFETERSLLGWQEFNEFRGYLAYQISLGRPVWTALPSAAHAVLIVGVGPDGIYINDPSGYLLEFIGKPVDEKHLNPIFLSWENWLKVLEKKGYRGVGFKHTLVITGSSAANIPPLAITVLSNNIEFTIPRPGNATMDFNNKFQWDGTKKPNGYHFTGLNPFFQGLPENNPTNSDTLTKFTVNLSNSRTTGAHANLSLLLDGKVLREKKDISIPARSTNLEVDLMKDAPYSFKDNPLKPGPHEFTLLLDEGGLGGDRTIIKFTLGPSQPTGLRGERTGDKVKLTWDRSPEIAKGLDDLVYVIWKDGQSYKTVFESPWEDALTPGDTKEHEYRVEAVSLQDLKLNSIVSDKVTVKPPAPTQPPTVKLPGNIYLGASPYQKETELTHGLYLITPNDGKTRQLSPRAISGVAISPDGTKLAAGFLQETGIGPGDPQLAIFDAKDPAYKLLRSVFETRPGKGPDQLTNPTWAKDSTTLAVNRTTDLHLYQYSTDKTKDKITFWAVWMGYNPAWSPTDNRLVVVGSSGDGLYMLDDAMKGAYLFDPKFEIWSDQASQGFKTLRQGAVTKITGAPNNARKPKWSPDGKNIMYISDGVLWTIPAAGGSPARVSPEGWKIGAAAYSPDSSYIAVVRAEAPANGGVWVIKPNGSEPKQVVKADFSQYLAVDLAWGP